MTDKRIAECPDCKEKFETIFSAMNNELIPCPCCGFITAAYQFDTVALEESDESD